MKDKISIGRIYSNNDNKIETKTIEMDRPSIYNNEELQLLVKKHLQSLVDSGQIEYDWLIWDDGTRMQQFNPKKYFYSIYRYLG